MTKQDAMTAQRSLVQRIERYLDTVEKDGVVLGTWETDLLCRAVAHLETGRCRIAEDVMLQVERPDLYRSRKALATVAGGPRLTVPEVRANVARVLQG